MHGTIEEYLRIHDVGEALSSLEELPRSAAGVLVLKIISKSLDTTRRDTQADLLRMCVDVARYGGGGSRRSSQFTVFLIAFLIVPAHALAHAHAHASPHPC